MKITFLAPILVLLSSATACALEVTNTTDSGAGSLSDAIANTPAGGTDSSATGVDNGTIILTSGQLVIDNSLIIDAPALAGGFTIDTDGANTDHRVLQVDAGVTVQIYNLTLRDGKRADSDSEQDGIGDVTDPSNLERADSAYTFFYGAAPFGAFPDGSPDPNGLSFFLSLSSSMTSSPVTENMIDYSEVIFHRSTFASDVDYQLNYSFDLVNWHVAKDGVGGVIITLHKGNPDKITVRVTADPSQRFFSYLTLAIGTP